MNEQGEVIEIIGDNVRVKIDRKSACGGNCADCGMCSKNANIIIAKNEANAQQGDTVMVRMSSGNVLTAAFLVYVLPLIMFFAGYAVASFFTKNVGICVFLAFIFMVFCFFLVHVYDGKIKEKYTHTAFLVTNKHTNE